MFIFLALLLSAPKILLTLQTVGEGAAVVGVTVTFVDEAGALGGRCVSDSAGRCDIQLTGQPAGEIIRGYLDLGPSGKRSLIWTAEDDVVLTLLFNDYGQLLIPGHEEHPTVEIFSDEPTPLPEQHPAITPTIRPTTEFVVINPVAIVPTLVVTTTGHIPPTFTRTPLVTPSVPPEATVLPEVETTTPPWWRPILCLLPFVLLWGGGLAYIWRKGDA